MRWRQDWTEMWKWTQFPLPSPFSSSLAHSVLWAPTVLQSCTFSCMTPSMWQSRVGGSTVGQCVTGHLLCFIPHTTVTSVTPFPLLQWGWGRCAPRHLCLHPLFTVYRVLLWIIPWPGEYSILIGWRGVDYHLSKNECAKRNVNNCQLGPDSDGTTFRKLPRCHVVTKIVSIYWINK